MPKSGKNLCCVELSWCLISPGNTCFTWRFSVERNVVLEFPLGMYFSHQKNAFYFF